MKDLIKREKGRLNTRKTRSDKGLLSRVCEEFRKEENRKQAEDINTFRCFSGDE